MSDVAETPETGKSAGSVAIVNGCICCGAAVLGLRKGYVVCTKHSPTGEAVYTDELCPSGLTPAQQRVFVTIKWWIQENGFSPTVRDIATTLGFKSPASAYSQMVILREKGILAWEDGQARTLRIISH